MASTRTLRGLQKANIRALYLQNVRNISRAIHTTPACRTDGVYSDLTNMRVRTPWVEALRKQREEGIDPTKKSDTPATPQDRDLKPKKMSDSFHRVVIPLAQDPWLLDNYLNANGHVRLGTLFMDLDALSGVIAYKHTGEDVTTVTAAVDRITINHPLKELCDIELSGQVTYATGRSSMEISCQVAKAPEKGAEVRKEDILMTCAFTMVSLDPSTKKPVAICPIKLETAEEKRLFALDPNLPTRKPDNVIYMDKTRLHSSQIMQPQYRNRHNFMIFGGFLLKQTFELAFCCAAAFSHSRPTFLNLDPSTFENPVPVGSVLYLTATAAYTDPLPVTKPSSRDSVEETTETRGKYTRVQIRIDSKVRNIEHGETKPTGQFNYTFLIEKDIRIMPQTYSEFMIWIDARRRAQRVGTNIEGLTETDADRNDDGKVSRVTE
ncbi:acyl-coenzyme A thioesterase 9, partial [Lecanoromycetidae sp. Uapishka_2]